MTLRPSFTRVVAHVAVPFLLMAAYAAYSDHSKNGHWWLQRHFLSLSIPFVFFVVFTWFAFVPHQLELSEHRLVLTRSWGNTVSIPLYDLEYFMQGRGTFMIQRFGESAYQIYPGAFASADWRTFTNALETDYPEKRASYYIGSTLYGPRKT